MRNFLLYAMIAVIGGFGYCAIEMVYRSRTHYSMFFAGAIILVTFYFIAKNFDLPFWARCIIGMTLITGIEFIFGIVFNIWLKEGVWDYSGAPLNIMGQVCLPFSAIWLAMSAAVFKILERI